MVSNYEVSRKWIGDVEGKLSDVNDELNESLSYFVGLLKRAKKPEEIKRRISEIKRECMKISDGLNALDIDPVKLEHTMTYIDELGCWVDDISNDLTSANALVNERRYSASFERLKGKVEESRAALRRISESSNTSLSDRDLKRAYLKIRRLKKGVFLIKQEAGKLRRKFRVMGGRRMKGIASALRSLRKTVRRLRENALSVRDAIMTAKVEKRIRGTERKIVHLLVKEKAGRMTVDRKNIIFRYVGEEVRMGFSRDAEFVLFSMFNHKGIRDGIKNVRKGSIIVASFERVISTPNEVVVSISVGERRTYGKSIRYAPYCFNFSAQKVAVQE